MSGTKYEHALINGATIAANVRAALATGSAPEVPRHFAESIASVLETLVAPRVGEVERLKAEVERLTAQFEALRRAAGPGHPLESLMLDPADRCASLYALDQRCDRPSGHAGRHRHRHAAGTNHWDEDAPLAGAKAGGNGDNG